MRVTLETDRLILRPFRLDDANDMFHGWASDDEVTKYVTWYTHENIETTKKVLSLWVEQYEKTERINFAITIKDTKELIGGIDVVGYLAGIPVIGYVSGRKHRGNGYMTEACKKVIEFLQSLGHNKIIIEAIDENIGSNKVIVKSGGVFVKSYDDVIKNNNVVINSYIIEK